MINVKNYTVVIPCISYKDVKNCIKKIREKYKTIKIIVCLNNFNFKKNKDKNLKFILTKSKSIGEKRNIAVNACKSRYLAFIDSDAYPGDKWIESTYKLIKKNKVGIIAGPHVDPITQNDSEKLIGMVKKSFLITMNPRVQKSNTEKQQFVSFLPSVNWVLTKKNFNSLKQMDKKLLRNEDWDFVYKMKKKKFKLLYSPKTLVYHKNGTISHFLSKRFKYGFYMWPILLKPNFKNYLLFAPLIFTTFLFSLPIDFFIEGYRYLYFLILSLYILVAFLETLRIFDRMKNFFKIFALIISGNIIPGLGVFFGIFNIFKK